MAAGWFVPARALLGLSWYAHLAARTVPLVVVSFGPYLAWFHRPWLRVHWRDLLLALAVAALVAAPPASFLRARWGQQELVGRLNVPLLALRRGDPRPVIGSDLAALGTFVWRGDPLAILVHLADDQGSLVAQGDAMSALSDTLHPGDVFVQQHVVELPAGLMHGRYDLTVGLYVREGGRLPLDSGSDAVLLGVIEVVGAGD